MTAASAAADEAGYVFRDRHPERAEVYRRFDEASAAARARLECRLDLAYGNHPRERLDLFPAAPGAPLVVFVHGGYWQSLDKSRFSFVAAALVPLGFSVALPTYPLAPDVGLRRIVEAVRRGVVAAVSALAAPPLHWIASGHSAGGHLAAMLALSPPVDVPLAACAPISGIFDVEPIVGTSLNTALGLDIAEARALSPIRQPPARCRLLAYVGEDETQAFRRQSRDFDAHWRRHGGQSACIGLRNRNHYTILADLLEEGSVIATGMLEASEAFARGE